MAFSGFRLPDISDNSLDDRQERRAIKEYLFQLTEQLRYMMNNLDEENFSEDFKAQIETERSDSNIVQRVEDVQRGLESVRRQTAEGFSQTVSKDGIISAINQSAELVQIIANKIALEGYVTINTTFRIGEDGSMTCTGGKIADFDITKDGLESPALTVNNTNGRIDFGEVGSIYSLGGPSYVPNNSYPMAIDAETALSMTAPTINLNGTVYVNGDIYDKNGNLITGAWG